MTGATLNLLRSIEAALLGWSPPPVGSAIATAGWRPDDTADWCIRCGESLSGGGRPCRCRRNHAVARPPRSRTSVAEVPPIDWIVRLGAYEEPLRGWLLTIKHRAWVDMAQRLGAELADQCLKSVDWELGPEIVVVPMPMPSWRRRSRGVDHARLLAESLAQRLSDLVPPRRPARTIRVCTPLLRRGVRPQAGRSAAARRREGKRGLAIRTPRSETAWIWDCLCGPPRQRWTDWGLLDSTVVLVDDVLTTGASAEAVARLLRRLGARKIGVAVAAVADFG